MTGLRPYLLVLALLPWGAWATASTALADPPPVPPGPQPQAPPAAPPAVVPPPAAAGAPPAPPADPGPPKPLLTFLNDLPGQRIEKADGTVVDFYRTNFVAPGDLITAANLMQLQKATSTAMQAFPAQNTVLIEGLPEGVDVARDALAYFDVATPQVFIEAKVVEITCDSNFEYGLDYFFDRDLAGPDTIWRGVSGGLSPPSFIGSGLPGGLPFQGTNLLFGLVGQNSINIGAFDLAFRALQESGKAEILSKPSILCSQGVPAEVRTTESFAVNQFTGANRSTSTNGAGAVASVNTSETYASTPATTGVTLLVTAKHVGERFVTIDLNPEVSGLAGTGSRVGGTNALITTKRSAKTTVTMGDGDMLVIGGLYTNRVVHEEARTPLLSDLPLIGTMFTRQHESKQRSELIFMLTPHIMRKNADTRVILPPAELERLEVKPKGDGEGERCEHACPVTPMEDVLFPCEKICRDQKRCAERAATRAAGAKTPAPPPPPPPPPPPSPVPAAAR